MRHGGGWPFGDRNQDLQKLETGN